MSNSQKTFLFFFILIIISFFMIQCNQTASPAKSRHENVHSKTGDDGFHFAVLGDRTGGHRPGVFKNIVREVNRLKPDIVLNVGDLIEGYTDNKEKLTKEWLEYLDIIKIIEAPCYNVAGNHDISKKYDKVMKPLFEKHLKSKPQYTFTLKNSHFIIFNSSLWDDYETLPNTQLQWLEAALAKKSEVDNTFVFMHKPYWLKYIAANKPDKMHDLFKKYKVTAVFTGHYHRYCSETIDGILYTEVGSSGGFIPEGGIENEGQFYHYLWAKVNGSKISLAVIKKDSVLPWDFMTEKKYQTISKIKREGFVMPAIEYEGTKPLTINKLKLSFANTTNTTIKSNLTWKKSANWLASPNSVPININSGQKKDFYFSLTKKSLLFPLPEVSIAIDADKYKPIQVSKTIAIIRIVKCPPFEQAPTIDGTKEELWNQAQKISEFCNYQGKPSSSEETKVYFGYDDKNLYILVEAKESEMNKLAVNAKKQDDYINRDDSIMFLFVADEKIGQKNTPLYQIAVNTSTIYDKKYTVANNTMKIKSGDISWQSDSQVKLSKKPKGWVMEMLIPVSSFGLKKIKTGEQWRMTFRRNQQRNRSTADFASFLSANWQHYGRLIFR